ncbi:Imm30 family immunity protein [Paenibacillus popilliae]|uniref:Immunity protein 30 domain-containing protein n=1 Tax=Paenibacillus popilliae ATCC 14706 TaxID=1212764 RepID=M9LF27_PAEPP|nr:Imm30 family immunity protein [Paenibacillus popilliae]GAC40800.1 hypothetical protein PPOP_0127 [Paenibacillus popilliae ATCC 14706]
MDTKLELEKVFNNRLLRTNQEVLEFERSLELLINLNDISILPDLLLGFDDRTEQHEVMFGLVHGIEKLYKSKMEEGLRLIASSVSNVINNAKEWMEILHYRILNHPQVRLAYGIALSQIDITARNTVIDLLKGIKKEDPNMFTISVDEVLANI